MEHSLAYKYLRSGFRKHKDLAFVASKFRLLQEYHLLLIWAHCLHKKMAASCRGGQSVARLCEPLLLLPSCCGKSRMPLLHYCTDQGPKLTFSQGSQLATNLKILVARSKVWSTKTSVRCCLVSCSPRHDCGKAALPPQTKENNPSGTQGIIYLNLHCA